MVVMTIGGWYKWLVVIVMTGGHVVMTGGHVVVTKRLVAMVVAFQLPGGHDSTYSEAGGQLIT